MLVNYEEFKETLKSDLIFETAKAGIKTDITEERIEKLNMSYDALAVAIPANHEVKMCFNLNEAYDKYLKGDYFALIKEEIGKRIEEEFEAAGDKICQKLNDISKYENIKNKLALRVYSANRNAELLKNYPHFLMEDLAIVYMLVWTEDTDKGAYVCINYDHLRQWGISEDTLKKDALENAPKLRAYMLDDMENILSVLLDEPAGSCRKTGLYVATTKNMQYGASVLAYPGFLEESARELDGSFYILPSSVHEVLLLPDKCKKSATAITLGRMIRSVNKTSVLPKDRLEDHAYHYDADLSIFETAEKYAARCQQ